MSTERLMTPYISQTKEGQCLAVERFSNNHQLSKLRVPFSYYCPGGSYEDHRADDVVLFTSNFSPSHFPVLSPSEYTPLEESQQGVSSFSRLNALATVNILSPASPWDEQTDTNHCIDAMGRSKKGGVKDMDFVFIAAHNNERY